jgi:hypothetical protein
MGLECITKCLKNGINPKLSKHLHHKTLQTSWYASAMKSLGDWNRLPHSAS